MASLLDEVYQKYREANRAYAVMLELTYRCVCRCVHCYINDDPPDEMTTSEVVNLLEQLKDEGVLDIGLTGGEIFLRDDLEVILSEAARRGFLTYLLTTGILIDEAAADMLKRYRIHHVEISLMGSTAKTHDLVMRHPGAFEKTMKAIQLLRERDIPIVLKNSVLRQNYLELADMAKLAESMNIIFSANASVLPKINGDRVNQECALDFDTAANLNPALLNGGLLPNEDSTKGATLTCNAGRTNCGISPNGTVYPCLIWRQPVGNVKENSFNEIWHSKPQEILQKIRSSRPEDAKECFGCANAKNCKRCPGMAYAESGNFLSAVDSACALAGRKSKHTVSGSIAEY